jgi:triosephosphate isomerase
MLADVIISGDGCPTRWAGDPVRLDSAELSPMRTTFIAGNWKMNLDRAAIGVFCEELAGVTAPAGVRLGVFPPSVYLSDVVEALAGTDVVVGAQTARPEDKGAFTGEVAVRMVKDVGARSVIVGHSERRHVFGETDEDVRARLDAALAVGLDVILCVGETLDERKAGRTTEVIGRQLKAGIEGIDGHIVADRITVAYEPVWAIGTGEVATPAQAQEAHAELRALASELVGADAAERLIIQYGGSVKPDNASELLACPDVDGALVGGASLDFDSLLAIANRGGNGVPS